MHCNNFFTIKHINSPNCHNFNLRKNLILIIIIRGTLRMGFLGPLLQSCNPWASGHLKMPLIIIQGKNTILITLMQKKNLILITIISEKKYSHYHNAGKSTTNITIMQERKSHSQKYCSHYCNTKQNKKHSH